MFLSWQIELKVKMSSLQAQLLSAKRNLSTTEESSSRDKSVLQSKLTEAQQHLKEAKAENELKKVRSRQKSMCSQHDMHATDVDWIGEVEITAVDKGRAIEV